jgi:hypothetical protein
MAPVSFLRTGTQVEALRADAMITVKLRLQLEQCNILAGDKQFNH